MRALLLSFAIAWPLVLATAVGQRAVGTSHLWADVIYAVSSSICHQRADRSFHTSGIPWPVCARCAGLYVAAPLGALVAMRRRPGQRNDVRQAALVCAALPTATALTLEWSGASAVGNVARCATALPLGAVLAFVLVDVAPGRRESIG